MFYKYKKGLKISPDCSENPFHFSLKMKRLQRKAGKWIAKMPKPFAPKLQNRLLLFLRLARLDSLVLILLRLRFRRARN